MSQEEIISDELYYIMRHSLSGVWICQVRGWGHWYKNDLRISGRRIWSWDGRRKECEELALKGVSENDKLGDWIDDVEIVCAGRVEMIPTTKENVEYAKSLPEWTPST